MITNKNIGNVLRKVEEEVRDYDLPIITLHAQMNRDPFRVLIATMLSLRTKDEVTAVASEKLFAKADTPEKILKLSEREIQKLIYPVGFYITKSKSILRTCKLLIDEHNSIVPDDIDTLVTFPGVGRKTANLVLIEGFQKLAMCVDTHVHRISNRWGYIQTKTPEETEQALRKKLPTKYWMQYNQHVVAFGQHLCVPISPKCSLCPIKQYCPRKNVTKSR